MEAAASDPKIWESFSLLAIAVFTFFSSLLGIGVQKLNKIKKLSEKTNIQVTNEHPTNLRDDITDNKERLETLITQVEVLSNTVETISFDQKAEFSRMHVSMSELHDQINAERTDRQALANNASTEHARIWGKLREHSQNF